MDRNGKFSNGLNGLGDVYNGQDEAEVELAFQVHRAEPGDFGLLNSLIERYAAEVSRQAYALLTKPSFPSPNEAEIQAITIRTFVYAIKHLDRFRGKTSLRNWLFGITIHQVGQTEKGKRVQDSSPSDAEIPFAITSNQELLVNFDQLPKKLRVVLILRYVGGLGIDDIKETLGPRSNQAHSWLVNGRRRLMDDPPVSHRSHELEDYVDGLLVDNLARRDELESHLPGCEACDTFLVRLREIDLQLLNALQERWPLPILSSRDYESLAQMIQARLPVERRWRLPVLPLKQTAWMVGLLALFVVTTFYLIGRQPNEPEFAPRPTATPTEMPIVEEAPVQGNRGTDAIGEKQSFTALTSNLSVDADSLAIVSTNYTAYTTTMITKDVYLYDTRSESLLKVSSSDESSDLGTWIYSFPNLSEDGRYLVFSQTSNGVGCHLADNTPCPDIFIYDRQSEGIDQITHGLNGAPANGISLAPVISADGRWVAFWSLASNLTEDDTEPCVDVDGFQPCLDIFLYDRQEDKLTRIPVGTTLSSGDIGPDRISISGDGALVGFTLSPGSTLSSQLGVQYTFQAVLYDRAQGNYELVNKAADGTPGDGESFGPVMSADGNILAFSSKSANLVEGDTNRVADVFVVDRLGGTIERVSINTSGVQADGNSGLFLNNTGFYSFDLSADGRFVTFLSQATNIGEPFSCDPVQQVLCNAVLLHDRQTGSTEVVRPRKSERFYMNPVVSGDGSWVSFTEAFQNCTDFQGACMQTMLYDRHRGWASNISKDLFPPAQAAWEKGVSINGNNHEVNFIAVGKSGKYMAAAYGDQSIELWDFDQQRWVLTIEPKSDIAITSLAIDPADEWLVAGYTDGMVRIWRISGGILYELANHTGRVHSLAFSPDGNELFVGTPNEVKVWRKGDGRIIQAYTLQYSEKINNIALSPSGNLLAVASSDKSTWLQLLPSGSLITRLGGQENVVTEVTFSADGSMLAAKSLSGEVNLWKIDWKGFGALNTEFVSSIDGINWFGNLAFSPDGQYLASGSYYEGIKLWDFAMGKVSSLYLLDPSQDIVSSVAFSPDGASLLAGGFGEVETWFTRTLVREPRYFQRVAFDESTPTTSELAPVSDWPSQIRPIGDVGGHLNLYEADEILPIDLLVPTRLPEHVRFVEAQLLEDGRVALHYVVSSPTEINADLYIFEHYLLIGETIGMVGANTPIQEVSWDNLYAEYVQGDWRWGEDLTADEPKVKQWIWDDSLPVQRIHMVDNDVSVSMYYQVRTTYGQTGSVSSLKMPSLIGEWQDMKPGPGLAKDDLIQIAMGMVSLADYHPSSTVYTTYQVREGDTCSGIAAAFGTSVEALASLNGLDADCNLIRIGDVFTVPQPGQRIDIEQADLDCDGQEERLQVFLSPDTFSANEIIYEVYLQDMSDMGLFKDIWQLNVTDAGGDGMLYPHFVSLSDCQNFVAFQLIKGGQPELQIYHWADGKMQQVLGKGTEIRNINIVLKQILVREQVVDPGDGICRPFDVAYEWDGAQFVELERTSTGGTCQ